MYSSSSRAAEAVPPFPGERIRVQLAVPDVPLVDQKGAAFRFADLRGQVVLVTGTSPQEGKTTTIVNLARVRSLRPHSNGECFLKLASGQEIKLSRSFRDKVELLLDPSRAAPRSA